MTKYNLYNQEDLDAIVRDLANDTWAFPINDQTYEAVATVILHAPPDMGSIDTDYIGNRVAKMMANKVAYDYLQDLKFKREIEAKSKQVETNTEVSTDVAAQN